MSEVKTKLTNDTQKEKKTGVKKVVTAPIKTKKKNSIEKVGDAVFSSDVKTVGTYLFEDIFMPSIKRMMSELMKNGIDMMIYGEVRNNNSSNNYGTRISYDNRYNIGNTQPRNNVRRQYDYQNITFSSKFDAIEVLDNMAEQIERYGEVTVSDYYEMVGVSSSYTDRYYGWRSVENFDIVNVRDGYVIRMSKAVMLR